MDKLTTCFILLFTINNSYSQVPADSLPGIYAGQYWYANPSTSPWVITIDTVYVSNVDSTTCKAQITDNINFSGYPTYYTDYFSCNSSPPLNFYTKFFNIDSIRIINDNIPQPYPDPPKSWRFYGKRISSYTVGIRELGYNKQVQIYPNPAFSKFYIYAEYGKIVVTLYSTFGVLILNSEKSEIDVSALPSGIYFVKLQMNNNVYYQKIIIQH